MHRDTGATGEVCTVPVVDGFEVRILSTLHGPSWVVLATTIYVADTGDPALNQSAAEAAARASNPFGV